MTTVMKEATVLTEHKGHKVIHKQPHCLDMLIVAHRGMCDQQVCPFVKIIQCVKFLNFYKFGYVLIFLYLLHIQIRINIMVFILTKGY